ncbi:HPr family phosphocarrier protein [Bacteroides sp. OttesenSCG-928-J23]|nr:HPr family phosphocarrier protein [Bacteroides sp. OttesenSCG-928-J23]
MVTFTYTITDELGLHARPAGLLVKQAAGLSPEVTLLCGEKSANAKRILAVMQLGAKAGDTVTFQLQGENEADSARVLQDFCRENL